MQHCHLKNMACMIITAYEQQLLSTLPVVFFGIFHRKLFELLVHLPVEVIPQEEGPESEQRVHLLRLAGPQPFPL